MNSRRKGKGYELELARQLQDYGYPARRGQQYCGANGDADVVGLPGVHIEAKRRAAIGNIYDWIAQARADARHGEVPTVWFRADNCETLVAMRMEDFIAMYQMIGEDKWKNE